METEGLNEWNPVSAEKREWSERAVCYWRKHKGRLCSTLNVYLNYIAYSWLYTVLGPSLPDLQLIFDIDLSKASWIFTCTALGYAVGCAMHGIIHDRLHILLLMAIYSILAGLMWIATPWCSLFWLLLVIRVAGGMCLGCIDAVVHARLFSIWGLDTGPYGQVLYVMLGTGGVSSALIVHEFILPVTTATETFVHNNAIASLAYNTTSSLDAISSRLSNGMSSLNQSLPRPASGQPPVSMIHVPYLISGCIALLSGATSIIEYIATVHYAPKLDGVAETAHSHESSNSILSSNISQNTWIPIGIMSFINVFITGMIDTYTGFLNSYLVHQLNWSPANGAFATSIFYVAFTAGNILAMCLTLLMTTRVLITVSIFIGAGSFVGMILSGYYLSTAGTWVCVIGVGLSLSPQWPASFTFIEESIAPFSGKLASLVMTAGSAGMFLNPLLVGNTMTSIAPISFGYVLLCEFIILFVLYRIVFYLCRNTVDAYERFHE